MPRTCGARPLPLGCAGSPSPHISRPAWAGPRFRAGLAPVRSPLLGRSLLISFPPLSDMLKFGGWSPLASSRMLAARALSGEGGRGAGRSGGGVGPGPCTWRLRGARPGRGGGGCAPARVRVPCSLRNTHTPQPAPSPRPFAPSPAAPRAAQQTGAAPFLCAPAPRPSPTRCFSPGTPRVARGRVQ